MQNAFSERNGETFLETLFPTQNGAKQSFQDGVIIQEWI